MSHSPINTASPTRRARPNLAAIVLCCAAFAACAPQTNSTSTPEARAEAAPRQPQPPVARGRQLAEMYCASCHAIGESGASTAPGAPPFRSLSSLYSLDALEEALAEGILVGHPMMPEYKFSPDQIDALIAYLQSIQTKSQG